MCNIPILRSTGAQKLVLQLTPCQCWTALRSLTIAAFLGLLVQTSYSAVSASLNAAIGQLNTNLLGQRNELWSKAFAALFWWYDKFVKKTRNRKIYSTRQSYWKPSNDQGSAGKVHDSSITKERSHWHLLSITAGCRYYSHSCIGCRHSS